MELMKTVGEEGSPYHAELSAISLRDGGFAGVVRFKDARFNCERGLVPWFTATRKTKDEALDEADKLWSYLCQFSITSLNLLGLGPKNTT